MNLFSYFERLTNPLPENALLPVEGNLRAFMRQSVHGYERALITLGVLTVFLAGLEVYLFNFLGDLVDWLGSQSRDTFLQEQSATLITISALVLIALPLAVLIHSMLFHQSLYVNQGAAVTWSLHRSLLNQSCGFFQGEFAGRVATRVTQTSDAIRETLLKLMNFVLYVIVYLTGMAALIFTSDWRLSLPLLFWFALFGVLMRFQLPRLNLLAQNQAKAQSELVGHIVDSYSHFTTLKLFSNAERETEDTRRIMQRFLSAIYPMMRNVTGLNVGLWWLNALLIFTTGALAILLWLDQSVTTGAIAVAIALTLRIKSLSQMIMWEVAALARHLGTIKDGVNALSHTPEVQDAADAPELHAVQGAIEIRDLCFAYPDQPLLFDHLQLAIAPGERVGIVGPSGAGKSTLIHLLLRLHDSQSGSIRIDGQAVNRVSQSSLRQSIGVVTQDTALLHRSIRDNLLYGRPSASEQEMIEAARVTRVHDFVQSLPQGYDTLVGERGIKLSGGQRQRIAIARVLIKDAPILVLDEATSALDSEVEADIQRNLDQLMQGKTVLAIAHRLSTIAKMDRLIVMEGGRIIEQGNHETLLNQGGLYARLWSHQSGGFIAD
ncbi:Lipid A export ATP-binding/permease protein MsbA [Marinobacterium lacunae]|uniref:Lipid A export ATP-binding/permease protein MsbA n=1 Tax=Marinobacterium lacunae TaxID=1232683 RepID=A0A081FVS8_9GAMM|nr:ABC transporter ATP-binding protein [Marinobacterium lacunae]KEA62633.1 Lipid A export ATP-binding/permease protein MsbA [Marinobacterium lacunae]